MAVATKVEGGEGDRASVLEAVRAQIVKLAKKALKATAGKAPIDAELKALGAKKRALDAEDAKCREKILELYLGNELAESVITDDVAVVVRTLDDQVLPLEKDFKGVDEAFLTRTRTEAVRVALNVDAIAQYRAEHGTAPAGIVVKGGRYTVAITDKRD